LESRCSLDARAELALLAILDMSESLDAAGITPELAGSLSAATPYFSRRNLSRLALSAPMLSGTEVEMDGRFGTEADMEGRAAAGRG